MKKNETKKKVLVLSDISNTSDSLLKSSISIAKIIDAEINLFYVKKPTDVVEVDNQFSAMRAINEDYNTVDTTIKNIIDPISKNYEININYNFSYGNVKSEINKYIKELQPDVIVIGKRKPKAIHFIGNNITDFVIKNHDGIIMIATEDNTLEPNEELSLGVLNTTDQFSNAKFTEGLLQHTTKQIKSFMIADKSNVEYQANTTNNNKLVEYVFEKNENVVKNLSNYLVKNDINLFCIDRGNTGKKRTSIFVKEDIKDLISKINVPLLFADLQKSLS